MPDRAQTTTASAAFLDALHAAGVSYIFANLGSDHPGLIEAHAEARATGRTVPVLITCPNEMVALSAAHGHAAVTGQAQAVVVHVECGTQALAGAVHNADKGRIPVLIFAGASPFTQHGELPGSRNEFIQWIQDVHDQRGLVRGYMRYDTEIRSGRTIAQLVLRALQFAHSDPQGPVYLMGAREVMEEHVPPDAPDSDRYRPIAAATLTKEDAAAIAADLAEARRPLVVTSHVGRRPPAVAALIGLCEAVGAGVLESVPTRMNFPHDHPLYLGNQWNDHQQNEALAEADVILVLDSDVPWIPTVSRPGRTARIWHVDVDPLKQQMPLWHIPACGVFRADAGLALAQITAAFDGLAIDAASVAERTAHYRRLHNARAAMLMAREAPSEDGVITPEYLTARVRARLDDDTIVLNEGITNYQTIFNHLRPTRPGAMLCSGGGSLGWNGGAAIGVKLAVPDKTVVSLTGDGSYMFSVPSSVHWMARRYGTPFLQVVYNNGGWKAPRQSALSLHPDGHASRAAAADLGVSFAPAPDHAGIAAAAGGAHGETVSDPDALDAALDRAWHAVRVEGRAAVLDVILLQV